jgi:hypothetical protein
VVLAPPPSRVYVAYGAEFPSDLIKLNTIAAIQR